MLTIKLMQLILKSGAFFSTALIKLFLSETEQAEEESKKLSHLLEPNEQVTVHQVCKSGS